MEYILSVSVDTMLILFTISGFGMNHFLYFFKAVLCSQYDVMGHIHYVTCGVQYNTLLNMVIDVKNVKHGYYPSRLSSILGLGCTQHIWNYICGKHNIGLLFNILLLFL